MNKTLGKLLSAILVTAMLLGAMPIIMPKVHAGPLPPPSMWVEPEFPTYYTNTTSTGFTFNETVWAAAPAAGVSAWNLKMSFDPTLLQVVALNLTMFPTSQLFTGHTTVPGILPVVDNVAGTVYWAEALSTSGDVATGTATLIYVTFQIIAAPPPGPTPLTCNIDPGFGVPTHDTYFLDIDGNEVPGITTETAVYQYWWAPPANVHLTILGPASTTFDKFTHWVGTTFTEDIYIGTASNPVSSGWFLVAAGMDFIYNGTLLQVTNVVMDPLWTIGVYLNNPGDLYLNMSASTPQSGQVHVATVTMMILNQREYPTNAALNYFDASVRQLTNVVLVSSYASITPIPFVVDPIADIDVYAFQLGKPPYLSVDGGYMVGPAPSIGQTFNVTVSIHNVSPSQNLLGVQYRLQYDTTLIKPVAEISGATGFEGPFFPYWASQQIGSEGTFFAAFVEDPDGIWGPHIVAGHVILPDIDGVWHQPEPDGEGVVAIFTFMVVGQSFGEPNIVSPLTIADYSAIGLDTLAAQNIVDVGMDAPVNGNVTISTILPGRSIDVYGGAVNSGWGPLIYPFYQYNGLQQTGPYAQFPAPYGGQGAGAPMDMVEPQSQVYLWANVTYNFWPVQYKNVAFEIQEPDGTVYTKLSAFTDTNGVAGVTFRMPWPCTNPESLFGVWHVTTTVQLADQVIIDTMDYHYDYIVHIWKVTTDMFQYDHGQTVQITITYGSHAQQTYPVLFVASIVDELGVTVGIATLGTTVGGTRFSVYLNTTQTVTITLPKWAYAGIATVHVNGFDMEPAQGGVAITPEYVGPTIGIQPY